MSKASVTQNKTFLPETFILEFTKTKINATTKNTSEKTFLYQIILVKSNTSIFIVIVYFFLIYFWLSWIITSVASML